ncbi:hypothetical protein C5167_006526 [Papaver somniferum]|uniref:Uncharacterized protein n=1 Tax=Papaver somniferum TaxID=3469 RepID=A0A4Y7JEI5_PAPSO|nr:hypothetical protein C5167_006526 [Papaver somniferum]
MLNELDSEAGMLLKCRTTSPVIHMSIISLEAKLRLLLKSFVTSKIASCAQGQGPYNGVFAQLHQTIALAERCKCLSGCIPSFVTTVSKWNTEIKPLAKVSNSGYSVNITLYGDKSINVLSRSRCYWD